MFTQAITPAIKSYMEVQVAFLTDVSRRMFDAVQSITELNLRLAKELLEDMAAAKPQLTQTGSASDFTSAATRQLQPSAQRWHNYQQQLSNLVANTSAEMSKLAQTHLPEARRTATAVAEEMLRTASQEAEKVAQRQREVLANMNESALRGIDNTTQKQSRLSNEGQTPGQQPH